MRVDAAVACGAGVRSHEHRFAARSLAPALGGALRHFFTDVAMPGSMDGVALAADTLDSLGLYFGTTSGDQIVDLSRPVAESDEVVIAQALSAG